jgi:hypothetical protein
MSDTGGTLPPDFKPWPPARLQDLVDEVNAKWDKRHGKHWALQVVGTNPISGYKVVYKERQPNDP